jgi:hypothetical protein
MSLGRWSLCAFSSEAGSSILKPICHVEENLEIVFAVSVEEREL